MKIGPKQQKMLHKSKKRTEFRHICAVLMSGDVLNRVYRYVKVPNVGDMFEIINEVGEKLAFNQV